MIATRGDESGNSTRNEVSIGTSPDEALLGNFDATFESALIFRPFCALMGHSIRLTYQCLCCESAARDVVDVDHSIGQTNLLAALQGHPAPENGPATANADRILQSHNSAALGFRNYDYKIKYNRSCIFCSCITVCVHNHTRNKAARW